MSIASALETRRNELKTQLGTTEKVIRQVEDSLLILMEKKEQLEKAIVALGECIPLFPQLVESETSVSQLPPKLAEPEAPRPAVTPTIATPTPVAPRPTPWKAASSVGEAACLVVLYGDGPMTADMIESRMKKDVPALLVDVSPSAVKNRIFVAMNRLYHQNKVKQTMVQGYRAWVKA